MTEIAVLNYACTHFSHINTQVLTSHVGKIVQL